MHVLVPTHREGVFQCNWVIWDQYYRVPNFLRSVCEYDQQATNITVVFNIPQTSRHVQYLIHTHKHTHASLRHTSHHQDLDFVLFVRPVEEGDAGILPKEGG